MKEGVRYIRRNVLQTHVGDDLILFDEARGVYLSTRGVGAAIWKHLSEPLTFEELCGRLMAEYTVAEAECAADTRAFLDSLLEAGIVQPE